MPALAPATPQRLIAELAQSAKVCSLRQDPCCAAAQWARELDLAARLRRRGSALSCRGE
jgi:hypothetical protein